MTAAAKVIAVSTEFADNGKTAQDVADHFGVTVGAVYMALRRAGESTLIARLFPRKGVTHGKASTYSKTGCRCEPCTTANRESHYRLLEKLKARPTSEIPHGPNGRSNYGCICETCVTASRDKMRERLRINQGARNNRRPWTPGDLAMVLQRQPDGRRYLYSARECAEALDRSVAAVDWQRRIAKAEEAA